MSRYAILSAGCEDLEYHGSTAIERVRRRNGVDGFSLSAGLTTPVIEEAETTRRMIDRTVGKIIVVATGNKIGVLSNFSTVAATDIDVLITDDRGDKLLSREELVDKDIELIVAR